DVPGQVQPEVVAPAVVEPAQWGAGASPGVATPGLTGGAGMGAGRQQRPHVQGAEAVEPDLVQPCGHCPQPAEQGPQARLVVVEALQAGPRDLLQELVIQVEGAPARIDGVDA